MVGLRDGEWCPCVVTPRLYDGSTTAAGGRWSRLLLLLVLPVHVSWWSSWMWDRAS